MVLCVELINGHNFCTDISRPSSSSSQQTLKEVAKHYLIRWIRYIRFNIFFKVKFIRTGSRLSEDLNKTILKIKLTHMTISSPGTFYMGFTSILK
jgi:hypothetical protein